MYETKQITHRCVAAILPERAPALQEDREELRRSSGMAEKRERYQWKVCQKTFSARQGTMFEGRSLACRADRDSALPHQNL